MTSKTYKKRLSEIIEKEEKKADQLRRLAGVPLWIIKAMRRHYNTYGVTGLAMMVCKAYSAEGEVVGSETCRRLAEIFAQDELQGKNAKERCEAACQTLEYLKGELKKLG